jgi:DNA-binding response OmpR family regulator
MAENQRGILVVDDDQQLNTLLCAYARLAGFGSYSALDGVEALDQARKVRPALILLDVMLPDIDGFEVCSRLKKQAETAEIPVLLLTALNRDEYRQRGKECGAAEYLTKPFDPDQLMRSIRMHANGKNNIKPGIGRHRDE